MIEPISIFGAVSATIGLLNLARQGINSMRNTAKAYKEYGKMMDRFISDLETTEYLLNLWESEWEIGQPDYGGEGIKYFGETGWEEIQKQLVFIDDTTLSLIGLLFPIMPFQEDFVELHPSGAQSLMAADAIHRMLQKRRVPPAVQAGRDFLESLPVERLVALQERKLVARKINDETGFGKKIKSVFDKSHEMISKRIEDLRTRYDRLKHTSDMTFDITFKNLSRSMPLEERRQAVHEKWDSEYAFRFRKIAISMSSALQPEADDPRDIGLDLDARRNPRTSKQFVDYKLVTEPLTPEKSFEVSVQAFGPQRPPVAATPLITTFQGAYLQAQTGNAVHLLLSSGLSSDLYFSITASPLSSSGYAERLADGIRAQHHLRIIERTDLAYRLADVCLLLLNTSWMSAFCSESLIVRIDGEQPLRYFLGFRDCDRARCQLLEQLGHSSEQQAYSIGIMLIEIAIQRKVAEFQWEEPPFWLKIEDGEMIKLNDAILKTKNKLGSSFQKIVTHCFYHMQLPKDYPDELQAEFEEKMLHDFYQSVFLPLKKTWEKLHRSEAQSFSIPRETFTRRAV